jgi:uncharacterized protein (DUF3084 family)
MNQEHNQPQLDSGIIEMLKVARNQVIRASSKNNNEEKERPLGKQFENTTKPNSDELKYKQFAESLVKKLISAEQALGSIEEELSGAERILLNIVEKKKQLEDKKGELIKVKDKIISLDKEVGDILNLYQV